MSAAYETPVTETTDGEPKPKTKKRLTETQLKTMRERYRRGIDRDRKNRDDARDDLKFKIGEQWPEEELKRRGDRPALTFPRMLSFIRQVTGDVRQNKPAIRVRPQGNGADKETADMWAGLIRNIEQQSFAGYIYAQAIENATSCGYGYWRIVTDYTSDDSFEQDIRLKGIPNPLSVVFDPDAQELDKSDARWVFIYTRVPKEAFEKQYPKARSEDFQKLDPGLNDSQEVWANNDGILIAEYWEKLPVTKTIAELSDGRIICLDDYDDAKLAETMGGATVVKERDIKSHRVVQHIVSGAEELEDPTEWATDDIPIIPVMGEETWVDERCVRHGLIRHAKDAQRAYNYARSTSIEVTSLQPKAPYLLSLEMIGDKNIKAQWDNLGNVNYPYLVYKSDPALPNRVPERIQPPVPAAGLLAEAQVAQDDMKAIVGIYDASLGARSNETSGKAINARKMEGDVSTFVYIDNGAFAISICGRQLVKLIPKIYDSKRVVRVLYDDGTDDLVKLNHQVQTAGGGMKTAHDPAQGFYDLSVGKYDVTVDAGPGFTTRRQEAAEGLKEFMQILGPQGAALFAGDLAKLQDWPGSVEIGEKAKRLLPPQLQEPQTGPDGQPLPPPEPPPPPELLKLQAEQEAAKQRAVFEEAQMRATVEMAREKQESDAQLAREKAMREAQLNEWKASRDAELRRWVAMQDIITDRMKAGAQIDLDAETQAHEQRLSAIDAAHNMALDASAQDHSQQLAEAANEPQGQAE